MGIYDVIIFSQGIKTYKRILKHISMVIDNDTKLLFRTSSDKEGNIKEEDLFIKRYFDICNISYHKKNGLLISILLKKKK
jgi:hypothetical protein